MKTLRDVLRLLCANWRTLALFELLFRAGTALGLAPLLRLLLDAAMAAQGYAYLTWENVGSFLLRPLSVALVVVVGTLLMLLSVFELAGVLVTLERGSRGEAMGLRELLPLAARHSLRALAPRNLGLAAYVLVLVPLVNLGVSTGVVRSLAVPEFVEEFIYQSGALTVAHALALVLVVVLLVRWSYALNAFVWEGLDFRQSLARSVELGRRRRLRDLLWLVGIQALAALVAGLVLLAGGGAAGVLAQALSERPVAAAVASSLVLAPLAFFAVVCLALSPALGYASVSALYLAREGRHAVARTQRAWDRERVALVAGLAGLGVCACAALLLAFGPALLEPFGQGGAAVQLTAHRGACLEAPENTMAAFRQAQEQGADWVELDLQQSADGGIFVSHDARLKRVSGVDKAAWELTLEEVRALDAGSHFSPEFAEERYPTLGEVLAWAKETGMRLNIELKPTGHERDLEGEVARQVREAGMGSQCVFTSMSYDCLLRLREAAPEVRRAYVMTLAYGDLCQLDAADLFSVEETSCTAQLVGYLHAQGREVLAWTVNDESNVLRVVENGVDGVITDDVPRVREALQDRDGRTPVGIALDWLAGLLA
ncbi:glycerophosphodiester phosphodiesterase family protein [Olsenella sp. DNF00959]|uniref:glycerophosphodiester phosphodiesterase family protein n=1 Tax=Olsenella TaxID=133925 RepID=UPI000780E4BA|nr:glycerophosphodiester phosphodiesterase family protein [Olsenella sp. DNF00959]KXB63998.1 glycerophosphodiester phosphodiesterase family protein [Olsenella sp. DNF00959]